MGKKWNDSKNQDRFGFILEIEASSIKPVTTGTYSNKIYEVYDHNLTWEEANDFCINKGGHLAFITSIEDDQNISAMLQKASRSWYYLGAKTINGNWKWTDSRDLSYTNWSSSFNKTSIASGTDSYLMKYKTGGQWIGIDNLYYPEPEAGKHIGFILEKEIVPTVIDVSSVSLNKSSTELTVGNSEELTATVKPDNATDKTVTWSSSDPSVATVHDGVINALKAGTTTVTAKAGDKTATCTVTVTADDPRPSEPQPSDPQPVESQPVDPQPSDPQPGTSQQNPFHDIYETDDYYDAVQWAYYTNPQITNGMDATHFGPQLTVTRGQAVTFLWRSQGCPEPSNTNNPFKDVPSSEYFYKPILWAVEQGITKGVDETHFNPMDTLSTQHMVTFMYRTKNPGHDGWSGSAAAWADDGNGRPFGVAIAVNNTTPCPRCDVVQFLYKLSH